MKIRSSFVSNSSSASFILKPKSFIGEMILRNISRIEVSEKNETQIKKEFYEDSNFTIDKIDEAIDEAIEDLKEDNTLSSCLHLYNSLSSFKESFNRKYPKENFNKRIFFEEEYQILKKMEIIFSKVNVGEKNCFKEIFDEWKKFKKVMKKGEKELVVNDETVYFKCLTDLSGDFHSEIIKELARLDVIEIVTEIHEN